MAKKIYIAYEGPQFTIEWYFTAKGQSQALEYFESLSPERKRKLSSLLIAMASMGKIFNEEKFIHEGDKIYAFKPTPDRFLCFFFTGAKIIITSAYEKKTNKMPVREKARALKYKEDFLKRIKEGGYYE